jgi:hypothetical protein
MKKTVSDLINRLPDNYQKDESLDNNIYKILSLLGAELDLSKEVFKKLSEVFLIDQAEGKNLDRIGENLQQQRGYLLDRIYRVLLKARIKLNISNGTINEIIEILATIFSINKSEIEVKEPFWGTFKFATKSNQAEFDHFGFDSGKLAANPSDCARIMLALPPHALNKIGFSRQWFEELITELSAAGVQAQLLYRGSFAFAKKAAQIDKDDKEGFDSGNLGAYFEPPSAKSLPLTR